MKKILALLVMSCLLACGCGKTEAAADLSKTTEVTKQDTVGTLPSLKDSFVKAKVVDIQGLSSIRPKMGQRWTLTEIGFDLKAGDWVRTDSRGANALQLRLQNRASVILGPNALIEIIDGETIKIHHGEIEVAPSKRITKVELPGNKKEAINSDTVFRVKEEKAEKLKNEPRWLQGFKGTIVSESLGSLVANVDGRNLPLTMGHHKVTVDIRDQIARTVIDESFVNNTDSQLEGVFYFPLPQDASISGFAMWINGERVDADIVEKQRAREIYETILRERRDPGLLEWTGGSIFKARVLRIGNISPKPSMMEGASSANGGSQPTSTAQVAWFRPKISAKQPQISPQSPLSRPTQCLLRRAGIHFPETLGDVDRIGVDDVVDAAIAAWSARRIARGEARGFSGGSKDRDRSGREIVIWG